MLRGSVLRSTLAGVWLIALLATATAGVRAQTYTHSSVVQRNGNPTLLVDGRPFFFFGAAFFYERIPASRWRASMLAVRALGFNTLDLYVPWNWHEVADGDFDFSGRTNAQRNLRGVLALARELDFKLIVRPGPVIRNEWRNGGYPAWLLARPEYGMPLHDILEGRYPATATLQNANSDDAAAEWLRNAVHMRYARRWLQTVLHEFAPVADRVIAVQLDDDQGAYIDNQTWPAPHLRAYLGALETTVRSVIGPRVPVFINTYEMKVTASAPVWAMGNWYQSDAYSIGEHDRAALEFSAGMLQTQTRYPVAISEFQAGWLAQPEDPAPRPADPTNTTLALHTLLGLGARGTIDFPAQDTVDPAGWEAPFANAAYRWDAALTVDLAPSARYAPTARFGALVRANGPALASARRLTDGAIAYLTSAYDATRISNADVFAIAARTMEAQHACRSRHLTCDLVDLRFISDTALRHYPFVVVPPALRQPMIAPVMTRLARYRSVGGRVLAGPPDVVTPVNGGIPDATVLLSSDDATAFLDVVNYDGVERRVARTTIRLPRGRSWTLGPLRIPARDALLVRSDAAPHVAAGAAAAAAGLGAALVDSAAVRVPLADAARNGETSAPAFADPSVPRCPSAPSASAPGTPQAATPTVCEDDRAADGFPRLTLATSGTSVTLAPAAGGRAFWFGPATRGEDGDTNVFTSVGSLRDDVEVQLPLSTTDRIGKYTRSFPAGTFNRPYLVTSFEQSPDRAAATLRYDAPDVAPNGARFERTVVVRPGESAFTVSERVTFAAGPGAGAQRAVRYDSFDTRSAQLIDDRADGAVGFFDAARQLVAIVAWPVADVEDAQLIPQRTSTVVRLRFTPGGERRTRYALDAAATVDAAHAMVMKERGAVGAKP